MAMSKMLEQVAEQGRYRVSLSITAVSFVMSIAATSGLSRALYGFVDRNTLIISAVVPLLIAPVVSWTYVKLMVELAQTRKLVTFHAQSDSLTGLSNRRHFTEIAENILATALTQGSTVSLAIIDVDRFKEVNDTHGHLVGDEVLRNVTEAIKQCTRDSDLAARFGGDEFVVVLPDTSCEEAAEVIDRIRGKLQADHPGTPGIRPTVSIGVASISGALSKATTAALDELLGAADRNLYVAKRLGRDRTELGQATATGDPESLSATR